MSAFKTPGDTANTLVTAFLCCKTAAIVHVKVMKSQVAYNREDAAEYVDAFSFQEEHAIYVNFFVTFLSVPYRW